ncbi:unnamed protein product, partial [Prorocentrum cordatum]
KTYQYGFSFDPVAGVAACRGEHGDAAGLLVHLEGAQGAYEAGQGGRLLRLEAMGPAAEMAKLKPRLGPLGCEFFVTEWAYRNEASAQGMTRAKPKAVQDAKKADAKKAGGAKHGPRPAKKGEARKTQAAPPTKAKAVLTEEQVSDIVKTWKMAAALGAETVGVLLFKQIFDIAPQALQLFAFKDEPNLYDSPKLKGHGVKVVTTVDAVVNSVRDLEALKPTLQDLGLRHVGYGVLPPHYDVVGKALLRTLKLGLQDAFTKRVEAAWTKLWAFVAKWCTAGNYPEQATAVLTEEQVSVIETTWKQAAALGAETVGVLLFKQIFDIAPQALQLFAFKDEPNLYDSPKLKGHGVKVVTTVDAVVNSVRDLEALKPTLQDLGLRHVGYGVLPPHYDVVGQALLRTLKLGLKDAFTKEVEAAWTKLWAFVAKWCTAGNYPEQDIGGVTPKKATAVLTEEQVSVIETTWKQAAALGAETVGVLLFKQIFDIAPQALQLFAFKDEPNLYDSPKLKGHGVKVVTTVDAVVSGVRDLEALKPTLQDLGLRHVGYGVLPPHYDVVGQALLRTLKLGLKDAFTKEVEAAWTKLWAFVAKWCTAGNYPAAKATAVLTEEQVSVIETTWKQAAALGAETVGVLLFKQIFDIALQALQLFAFKDEPNLYDSPKLKGHGVKVVTTVDAVVNSVRDLEALKPTLQDLGLRHVGYGVLPPHYDVVGQALLRTLKLGLKDAFTKEVEAAWTKLWAFVAKWCTAGNYPAAKAFGPAFATAVLTEEQVSVIQTTWKQAAALGAETVGVLLFKQIFDIAPQALQLFAFKDEPNLYDSSKLKGHGVKVVTTVDTVVSGVRDLEALKPTLQDLGLRHVGYGVLPPHYDVVGQALLRTLKLGLKDAFTKEVEAAWTNLWAFVAKWCTAGNYPEQDTGGASPKKAAKATAVLTKEQVSVIQKTWKQAAALGAETVGVLLFKQIFDIAPQALQLFAFKDEPNLYDSPKLKGHGVKVVTTVGTVVSGVRDLEALKPTLQDLGLRHVGYGVLPPHYDVVGQALLRTLKLGLKGAFTKEVEAAWAKLWAFVAKWCTAGNYPEQDTGGASPKKAAKAKAKPVLTEAASAAADAKEKKAERKAPRKASMTEAEAKEMVKELIAVAKAGKTAEVEALIQRGVDVNLSDTDGNTALHLAAQEGSLDTVNALLAAGADPAAQVKLGEWGNTPLHLAARAGHREVAEA